MIGHLGSRRRTHSGVLVLAMMVGAAHYAQARQVAPAIQRQTHSGLQRGSTITLYVDGINLSEAEGLLFNHPGLSARILRHRSLPYPPKEVGDNFENIVRTEYLHDGSTKDRLKVELTAAADVEPGIYRYRVRTPLGVTNARPLAVGILTEVGERSGNDSIQTAQEIEAERTVLGEISRAGDVDYFRVKLGPNRQTVFRMVAEPLGSRLDSVLRLWDASGSLIDSSDTFNGADGMLVRASHSAQEVIVSVSDRVGQGGNGFHYRLEVGALPVVISTSPSGLVAGQSSRVRLEGTNLPTHAVVARTPGSAWGETQKVGSGMVVNPPNLPIDRFPIVSHASRGEGQAGAQTLQWPATVEGTLTGRDGVGDSHWFRFTAEAGEVVVIEVNAQRHGSSLDPVVEVMDQAGKPVPRAVVRCLAMTDTALSNRTSRNTGFRINSPEYFAIHDLVMAGGEILRVESLPRSPDDDIRWASILGRRAPLFDTTAEAHPVGTTVYKVKLFPPGTEFSPNGMPVFDLHYRNDDAGPLLDRDSMLTFTAPARGDYWIRLGDSRGQGGDLFTYRMTVRPPVPDFKLLPGPVNHASMRLPRRNYYNLSPGGRTPVGVVAQRLDGFDGPIDVRIVDLPAGVSATTGVIQPDSVFTTLVVSMEPDARFAPTPLRIIGKGRVAGRTIERRLGKDEDLPLLAMGPPPDLTIRVSASQLTLERDREISASVEIERRGFEGRVPVEILGLPPGVHAVDLGLNAIMVDTGTSSRSFTLYAEPWAKIRDLSIVATARIESDSPVQIHHASTPVSLRVLPRDDSPDTQVRKR